MAPKQIKLNRYEDQNDNYSIKELIYHGLTFEQAKKVRDFMNNDTKRTYKSFDHSEEHEIPYGDEIELLSGDEYIYPRRQQKKR